MEDIKGNVFKLAGFELRKLGRQDRITDVFAVFCGVNDDADSPPRTQFWGDYFKEGFEPPLTTLIEVGEVANLYAGFNNLAKPRALPDYGWDDCNEKIALDLGVENLGKTLSLLTRIKMPSDMPKQSNHFIPLSVLNKLS